MVKLTEIPKMSYGIDVASYQSANLANYIVHGTKYAIVKVTQGTNYINPNAQGQISSSEAHGLMTMGYFYGTFSSNSTVAISEANYAMKYAKTYGIPKGSYFAVDWESGSGNYTEGSIAANTNAIIEAMKVIKKSGYQPLLYSGEAVLNYHVDTHKIIKSFGDCLWVAKYATMGRIDIPDFTWFPSMDGVAIWQFTQNWKGLSVDGNINVLSLKSNETDKSNDSSDNGEDDWELTLHPIVKWDVPRVFVVSNLQGCNMYSDSDLAKVIGHLDRKASYKVLEEKNGALKLGANQWVDGRAGVTKSNPIFYNPNLSGRIKVVLDHTHALASPDADAAKVYALETNKIYHVTGRKGRFFALKDKPEGKTVWVTGNRAYIVL